MAKQIVFEVNIKGAKDVLELQKRLKELQQQLKKTDDPTFADELLKKIAATKIELDKAKQSAKLAQAELTAKDETVGSYKRLSAQLFVARERFKELATSGKATAKELDAAQREANRLQNQLKRVDEATGQFGRNVGNYAGSLKGLFGSLRETIRTNRLLQTIPNTFNLIFSAIDKVEQAIDSYNTAFDASYVISKKVKEATGEVVKEYVGERIELDTLVKGLKSETATREQKQSILDTLNAKYPDTFNNLDLENLKVGEIDAAYQKANKSLLENIKQKTIASILEKQLTEATEASLEQQKQQAVVSGTISEQLVKSGASIENLIGNNLSAWWADNNAQTAKAAINFDLVSKTVTDLVNSVSAAIPEQSAAFGDLEKITKDASDKTAQSVKAAEEKKRKEYEETVRKAKEAQAQFAKDQAQFIQQQAESFNNLQKELSQAVISNIADEGTRAVEQEKFNFQQRKAERDRQFAELVAKIEAQEQRIIEVFGENSQQVIDFRKETAETLARLEAQYAALSEQDAITHQNALTEIEKQGQQERSQQEQEAFAARIAAEQAAFDEIEANYQLQVATIQESLAKQTISVEQAAEQQTAAQRTAITEQIELIQRRIDAGLFATEQERQQLVLQRQQLNTELAQLEAAQTQKVEQESQRRKEERQKEFAAIVGYFQQGLDAVGRLADAVNQAEIKRLDAQLEARQKNIDNLSEQLQNASGLEREYLAQKVAQETAAAEAIARQKERIEKQAAKTKKALAIIQAVINTALGITNALASLPPPASFVTAAITGVLGAVEIATIAAQPLAKGGYTGSGAGMPDGTGFKQAGVVHEGEWVAPKWLVESSQYGGLISGLESARVRGYAGGGFASPSVPSVPSSLGSAFSTDQNMIKLIEQTQRLAVATNSRLDRLEVVYTPNTQAAVNQDQKDRANIKTTAML